MSDQMDTPIQPEKKKPYRRDECLKKVLSQWEVETDDIVLTLTAFMMDNPLRVFIIAPKIEQNITRGITGMLQAVAVEFMECRSYHFIRDALIKKFTDLGYKAAPLRDYQGIAIGINACVLESSRIIRDEPVEKKPEPQLGYFGAMHDPRIMPASGFPPFGTSQPPRSSYYPNC
jgi:hypothetical protein